MLIKAKDLTGFRLHAVDGEIGKVEDLFFDDETYAIHYLVADTDSWRVVKHVLIAQCSLGAIDFSKREIATNLTKLQIEMSPSKENDKPVSRQYMEKLAGHYGWTESMTRVRAGIDPHLRSVRDLVGNKVYATDGVVGYVDDFIVDDDGWAIRYIVVDSTFWLSGSKVLVIPEFFGHFNEFDKKIFVSKTREAIRKAPEFKEHNRLNREYEVKLHQHYDCKGYWLKEAQQAAK